MELELESQGQRTDTQEIRCVKAQQLRFRPHEQFSQLRVLPNLASMPRTQKHKSFKWVRGKLWNRMNNAQEAWQ